MTARINILRTPAVIVVLLVLMPLAINAQTQEKKMEIPRKKHFMARLMGTRDTWPGDMTAEEEKVMGEHFQYLKNLVRQKKVIAAGPVFDYKFGMIIAQGDGREEVDKILKNDPSVKAGLHKYDISDMSLALLMDNRNPDRYVAEVADKMLVKEVTVDATLDDVWQKWTTTEGVNEFFSPNAHVDLRIGGRYEIYFLMDQPYGMRGSEDCRILSYLPKRMLSFEWNAPPTFGELRDIRTWVVLEFDEIEPRKIKVTLSQYGWGEGEKWQDLFDYFDRAWGFVLGNFAELYKATDEN